MNPKIAQHQQRNAQTRLRQRYAFLNIGDIQSTDGDIAQRFADSGIYRINRPAAARFPFHQNGEINRAFHQAQHQAARAEIVRRILALHADTAWISLRENGFVFWAFPCLPCRLLWAAGLNSTAISRCIWKTATRWTSTRRSMNGKCWKHRQISRHRRCKKQPAHWKTEVQAAFLSTVIHRYGLRPNIRTM